MVEGARLEIVWAERSRRFESSRFRQKLKYQRLVFGIFVFEGSITEVRRQIGNAVPPVGVQEVARRLMPLFTGEYEYVDLMPEYEKMKAMTVKQRLEYVTSQMN